MQPKNIPDDLPGMVARFRAVDLAKREAEFRAGERMSVGEPHSVLSLYAHIRTL